MRLLISAILLMLLTAGAQAQFSMDQKKKDSKQVENPQQRKDDDKAFERAQRLVPNANAPHDPWGTVRSKK
jgi:hypothetical protein